jgi:hypothetical protein
MACGLLPGGRHARPHPEELRDLPEHEGILHLGRQALRCGGSDGNDEVHGSDHSYDEPDGGAGDDRLFGGDDVYYNDLDDHGDAIAICPGKCAR